jgi:hypothetical protein
MAVIAATIVSPAVVSPAVVSPAIVSPAIVSPAIVSPAIAPGQAPAFSIDVAIEPARPVLRSYVRDEEMPDCLDGAARTRRIKRLFLLFMVVGLAAVFAIMIASQFRPR